MLPRHEYQDWRHKHTFPYQQLRYNRDDFAFRIVNLPHMESGNIPANLGYSVYISQLVRYARICTSKVDFRNRPCQQGFETNLLQKSFNQFFNRNGLIFEKYGAALREMRLAIHYYSYG